MRMVGSTILFAIGIPIDIAVGFIFLFFFSLGKLSPPSVKKMRKIKPMAMSMVMPMANRLTEILSTFLPHFSERRKIPHLATFKVAKLLVAKLLKLLSCKVAKLLM